MGSEDLSRAQTLDTGGQIRAAIDITSGHHGLFTVFPDGPFHPPVKIHQCRPIKFQEPLGD